MSESNRPSEDWVRQKKKSDGYREPHNEDEKTEKKIRTVNILIAAIAAAVVVLAAVLIVPLVQKNTDLDTSVAYESGRYSSGSVQTTLKQSMQADLFASDLVVTEDGITNEAVNITDETEGNLLVNLETGETLYAQNIYTKLYPASITKLMTAIVCMKYGNMDDVVVMQDSDIALEDGAQLSGLSAGDQLTMDQLLHILLVYSANDAGMAIARTIAGSESAFVDLMNQEAETLGMTGTHFENPHGLHDDNHYTTVYDVYLMLNAAYQYEQFTDISSLSSYTAVYNQADGSQVSSTWYSTDQYLTGAHATPEGVNLLGGKTGTTDEAGSCLTLIAQNRYGVPFIAVVLYSYNHTTLYEDMDQLLNRIND